MTFNTLHLRVNLLMQVYLLQTVSLQNPAYSVVEEITSLRYVMKYPSSVKRRRYKGLMLRTFVLNAFREDISLNFVPITTVLCVVNAKINTTMLLCVALNGDRFFRI